MKLKTSFFNCGLLKSNLKRFWPLYLSYFAVLLLAIPMSALDNPGSPAQIIIDSLSRYLDNSSLIVTFITAISAAMCVYGFMYNQKTCGMIASLPLKRKTIFASAAGSGIIPILIINLIVGLITAIPMFKHPNDFALEALLIWFAVTSLHYIAFFGIASFIAVTTGSSVGLPVFYIVFNFIAIGIETAIRELFSYFIYGFSNTVGKLSFQFLSPFVHMFGRKTMVCNYAGDPGITDIVNVYYPEWRIVLIYAGVGVAFMVASMFIFRKRKMENCGDVIAVPFLRPVFKYSVALCAAMANALLLRSIFGTAGIISIDAGAYLAYLIIGAFIGYFGSEMLMRKRFGVFKGNWLGFALLSVFCAAFMWGCVTDYAGIGSSTPEIAEIGYIELNTAQSGEWLRLEEPTSIKNVIAMNKSIIENKDTHLNSGLSDSFPVCIDYHLKGGRIVSREYEISSGSKDFGLYQNILGSTEAKKFFTTPDVAITASHVSYSGFNCFNDTTGEAIYLELTAVQAVDFFRNGYTADINAGNLDFYTVPSGSYAYVEIQFTDDDGEASAHGSFCCYIYSDCEYSIQWALKNLNIDLTDLF